MAHDFVVFMFGAMFGMAVAQVILRWVSRKK
jgi:hypothetical protein